MATPAISWRLDELGFAGRENLDLEHSRRYDDKENASADAEVRFLERAGLLGPDTIVVDLGSGTGQFAVAVAERCHRVYAVDVSPVMRARLDDKTTRLGLTNIEVVDAGFLSYQHRGRLADLVYSRYALHHLPDFWKAIALARIAEMVRPGGALRLWDIVYHFDPSQAAERLDAWIARSAPSGPTMAWTSDELAEHVRDEHSTYSWLLEAMIDRAGFDISGVEYDDQVLAARYLCIRR